MATEGSKCTVAILLVLCLLVISYFLLLNLTAEFEQQNLHFGKIRIQSRQKNNEDIDDADKDLRFLLDETKVDSKFKGNILNPDSYATDQTADCYPLPSAERKEPVCSYKSGEDNYISKVLHTKNGVWEANHVYYVKKLMRQNPDFGFIDIGTNVGVYLVTIASMKQQVIGVEPFPPTLLLLANSLQRSPHLLSYLRVVTNPLSDRYENVDFYIQDKNPGATRTYSKETDIKVIPTDHTLLKDVESVHTIKTDDLLPLITFKRAILKIDIEGAEMKALKSASGLFTDIDIRYVFMEWNKKWEIPEEAIYIINFFAQRGYTVNESIQPFRELGLNFQASRSWPFDIMWIKKDPSIEQY